MRDGSKFEVVITPNIFSFTHGEKSGILDILCAETYEEALKEMHKDIESVKDSPIANAYHYDIWEYDEETRENIVNEWVFDWTGKEIENFEEWLKTLSKEELKNV